MVALGQTVLWDEPTKAVLLAPLREVGYPAPFWIGVMDTDYFSKSPTGHPGQDEFEILPHNDHNTRDLWVATGELSQLFGSETIPTREKLTAYGAQVEKVARTSPEGRDAFLNRITEAWGWRGLVFTGSRRLLAAEVPLKAVLPRLMELLHWGLEASLESLLGPSPEKSRQWADQFLQKVQNFAQAYPEAKLTDLYLHLAELLLQSLTQAPLEGVKIGLSSGLFRFNRETCRSPRFSLLQRFLSPSTRSLYCESYNEAVAGSEIYTLDKFGPGALPFDVVIPGYGRGTLCLLPGKIVIAGDEPLYLKTRRDVLNVCDLAEILEQNLGQEIALVGKAIVLIAMMASEFIVVLNELGSSYVWRTRKMALAFAQRGVPFPLYPILRLRYPTWDVVGHSQALFRLPPHLARAFGKEEITSEEFARSWRQVRQSQQQRLLQLKEARSPWDLIQLLANWMPEEWSAKKEQYAQSRQRILQLRKRLQALKDEIHRLFWEIKALKAESEAIAREKGRDWRALVMPLREQLLELEAQKRSHTPEAEALRREIQRHQERRKLFDEKWQALHQQIRVYSAQIQKLREECRRLLSDPQMRADREQMKTLDLEAHRIKVELIRDALLTVEGLERTHYRPSAWWFLLTTPNCEWFQEIARRTEAYLEPLSTLEPSRCKCQCGS